MKRILSLIIDIPLILGIFFTLSRLTDSALSMPLGFHVYLLSISPICYVLLCNFLSTISLGENIVELKIQKINHIRAKKRLVVTTLVCHMIFMFIIVLLGYKKWQPNIISFFVLMWIVDGLSAKFTGGKGRASDLVYRFF